MNIIAIRLVLVGTKTSFIIRHKVLTVVVPLFECVYVNSTFFDTDSLPLVLIWFAGEAHL